MIEEVGEGSDNAGAAATAGDEGLDKRFLRRGEDLRPSEDFRSVLALEANLVFGP